MIKRTLRSGASEFWLLAGLSTVVVGGLVLLLLEPWNRPSGSNVRSLVFYCAAGIAKPVQEIVNEYQTQYGIQVQVIPEGSGQLLSKIRATHLGDLFLSADQFHIDKARKEGLVAEVIPVAILQPVLIVKTTTQEKLAKQGKPLTGLKDLLRPELKVVIANPELAAIGKTAKAALSDPKIALWPQLEKELKQSSNRVSTVGTVNEVATAVRTGDGFIGIVWRATAQQTDGVAIIASPELEKYKELIQIGILTSATNEQATAALRFARFLTARDRGLLHFTKHHFEIMPDADLWAEQPHLHLSAGAMLRPGIDDVVRAFEKREGIKIDTSYAGCGLLVAQMKSIKKGGQASHFPDAYFACDTSFLDMQVEDNLKVKDWFEAGKIISTNELVIIVPKGNSKGITKLEDLAREGLKIGLGHGKNSALGKLTDDFLKKLDPQEQLFTPDWKEKVTRADAGHDLTQKVRLKALDAAIVYRSNAKSHPDNAQYLDLVDIDLPNALGRQPFAIAKDSQHKYLMQRLFQALVAQQTADHFQSLGFRWVYDGK